MTYYELFIDAVHKLNFNQITIGEYEEMIKPLKREIEQQPCEDAVSRDALDEKISELTCWHFEEDGRLFAGSDGENTFYKYDDVWRVIRSLSSVTPQQTSWIPIKTRPMTDEEKEEIGHEYAYMYDCPLPDDGQDVLITDRYGNVEIDTFCSDYEGVYFENNCDDDEVTAWQPLPEKYEEGSEKE